MRVEGRAVGAGGRLEPHGTLLPSPPLRSALGAQKWPSCWPGCFRKKTSAAANRFGYRKACLATEAIRRENFSGVYLFFNPCPVNARNCAAVRARAVFTSLAVAAFRGCPQPGEQSPNPRGNPPRADIGTSWCQISKYLPRGGAALPAVLACSPSS